MTRKEWMLEAAKSAALAIILFFSAVFVLLAGGDMEHLALFSEQWHLILGSYLLAVVLVKGFTALPAVKWVWNKIEHLFQGFAMTYWIGLIVLPFTVAGAFVEAYVRYILLANALVLLCVYIGSYLYMKYIADEMNRGSGKKRHVLLVDLERRPRSEDEFMECIATYCRRNGLDCEVLHYGMPAEIRMDGILYRVRLTEYCSMASGIVPALEFAALVESGNYGIVCKEK